MAGVHHIARWPSAWALAALLLGAFPGRAQLIARLVVDLPHAGTGLEVPVRANLDGITHLHDSALTLVQAGKGGQPVAFQVEHGNHLVLTWLVPDHVKKQTFELRVGKPLNPSRTVTAQKDLDGLILRVGGRNLLRYQHGTMEPPPGIDSSFRRSAFIHPLWTPHGQELTRVQAPDHYHHYGLWNPWTHTLYEGDTVDFWNLRGRQGTVRFGGFVSIVSGPVFGEYAARHEHVAFPPHAPEKVAVNELQTVRVYAPQSGDYYFADMTIQLNCPSSPLTILEYRYGGLGWRANAQWTKENSKVLTSEGHNRQQADGARARWCIVEGPLDGEQAGAVMMSYPANYNHPEPLRIWPENANNNRGDMFANFAPTKNMDWHLEPGRSYVLRYRLLVFNGNMSKEKAESAWRNFATPPMVTIIKP